MGTRHRKIDTGNIGHKTHKDTVVTLITRQRKIDMGNSIRFHRGPNPR